MNRVELKITIVGVTDGGPASLPPRVLERVREAEVLCGGERHLALFPEVAAERWVIRANIGEFVERLKAEASKRRIVILASGDPLCYGIAATLRRYLAAEWLEIIPNVTAAQLAFARISEPWHDAVIVSAHGRGIERVVEAAGSHSKVAVYTDDENSPAVIARALLSAGVSDRRAVVCEHLDGAEERITDTHLSGLLFEEFGPLNVLLLLEDQGCGPGGEETRKGDYWADQRIPHLPLIGVRDDQLEHEAGLLTKQEVRVVALAKLGLHEDSVVWEIGAGSGSVAIEAARLARQGQVYAVEREARRTAIMQRNIDKFGVSNVRVVHGEAPDVLHALPDPDAIFIGGSGGHLRVILDTCCSRVKPGGCMVANFVTLENLHEAVGALKANGFGVEMTQVSISRSVAVAGLTRFEPLCPVFVVEGRKEQG